MPTHFLESTDSILSRPPQGAVADSRDEAQTAQVMVEAFFAFAFGLDLVVSQSTALDSYALQRVLAIVAKAWPTLDGPSRERPRPIRLYLHGHETFRDAAAATLAGLDGHGAERFESSLLGDLMDTGVGRAAAAGLRGGRVDNPLAHRLDGPRGSAFDATWEWFRDASVWRPSIVVPATSRRQRPDLHTLVTRLLDDERFAALAAGSPELADLVQPVRARLAYIAAQVPDGTRPFAKRGPFFSDRPWTLRRGRRAAVQDLCGDELDLVREVVSTLYNRVVAESIADTSASYTTSIADAAASAVSLCVQDYALAASSGGATTPVDTDLPPTEPFVFRLTTSDERSAADHLFGLLDSRGLGDCFAAVLAARSEQDWQDSIHAVEDARRRGDRAAHADAVSAHLDLLGRQVHGLCRVDQPRHGIARVLFHPVGIASAAATAQAGDIAVTLAGQSDVWLNSLAVPAAGLIGGAVQMRRWVSRRRTDRREHEVVRESLATIVAAPGESA